ncbi:hypothetical protein KC340_g13182 [Hortaea werneckii]|nr:hypothetical protein KC342_g4751 [Hortaea werneckii]KAI7070646.1 hypothetical protein KC339_g14582 [Hortaea werneckii]KAI7244907.1 hypothetical protein KC365_g969 [Hortaea werneckii]KAI7300970.1 hypothetical protein KC340_g13182 [Hortaea werneckii]KAI7380418.1 hypothetical protein KC328_g12791 [Hortaea werneckii]
MAPKKKATTSGTTARTKAVNAASPLRTSPRKTRPSRKKTEAEEITDTSSPSKATKSKLSTAKTTTKSNAAKNAKASTAKKKTQGDDALLQSNEARAEPQKPVRSTKKSCTIRTEKTSPVRKKSIGEAAYRPEVDENEDDQDEIKGTQKTKRKVMKDSDVVASPPKKRGRPRKNAETGTVEEASSPPKLKTRRLAVEAAAVAKASPPKKRGRPRKEPSNDAASAETTQTLPKRRGRPPKDASATIPSAKKKDAGGEKPSAPGLKGRVPSKTTDQRPTSRSPPKSTKAATTSKPPSRTTRSVFPAKGKHPSTTDHNPPLNRAAITAAYKYLGLPPRKVWSLPDTAIATAYRDRLVEDDGMPKDDLREALKAIAYARGSATLVHIVREVSDTELVQRLLARSPSRARSVSPTKKNAALNRERAGSGGEGVGVGRKRESLVALGEEWTDSPAKKVRKGSAGGGLPQSRGGVSGGRNFSVGGVKQSIESAGGRSGSSSPGRKRTSKSMSPTRRVRGSEQPAEKSRSVSPARRAAVPRTGSASARASPARGRSKSPGTEASKASIRARPKSAGAGKGYGELNESSIPPLASSARSPSRTSRRSPSPRRQKPNAELAPQPKPRSPQAPINASQSTTGPRRSASKSPGRKISANPPPAPPPNSRTVSGTIPSSEKVQVIPKGQPSGKDRGPVHSSTNPQFIPNDPKQRSNPFFETMPGAEVWHQRMPSFFPFGETPYLERVKSQQIEEDLAYDHSKKTPDEASSSSPEKSAGAGGGGILEQAGQALARIREVFSPKRTEHESEVLEEEEKPIPIPYDPVFALPKVTEDAVEAFMMGERREGGRESAGTTTAGQKRRGSSASGSRKRRKSLGS